MRYYDLLYYCEQCHDTHPMGVRLELIAGPQHRMNLRAYAAGESLPKAIAELIDNPVLCPISGKSITPNDLSRIYIQPLHPTA